MEQNYSLLKLPISASHNDVKNAYKKLAKIYHPDQETGSKDMFIKIQKAYKNIISEKKRESPDQVSVQNSDFTLSNEFSKLFSDDSASKNINNKNNDIIKNINFTYDDFINKKNINLCIDRNIFCDNCNGDKIDVNEAKKFGTEFMCAGCRGVGSINKIHIIHHAQIAIPECCDKCLGLKYLPREEILCRNCEGKGFISDQENILISHLEIFHKSQIIIVGKGNNLHNRIPGDLIINIKKESNDNIRISDDGEILILKQISLKNILEKEVKFQLLSDKVYCLMIDSYQINYNFICSIDNKLVWFEIINEILEDKIYENKKCENILLSKCDFKIFSIFDPMMVQFLSKFYS